MRKGGKLKKPPNVCVLTHSAKIRPYFIPQNDRLGGLPGKKADLPGKTKGYAGAAKQKPIVK